MTGNPIIGYASAYPADLVSVAGGGVLVPMGNHKKLGEILAQLCADRQRLANLQAQAFQDGARFTSERVFAERSDLIKRYLGPAVPVEEARGLAALGAST